MTLVGYWPLNEEDGDTAFDHSGNENHGDVEGEPVLNDNGILAQGCFNFAEGSGSYGGVRVPGDESHNVSRAVSASAWIYRR